MRETTLDEYYLSEQDEPTVQEQIGTRALQPRPQAEAREAVPGVPTRPMSGIRRRLHVLRRAAGVALAA